MKLSPLVLVYSLTLLLSAALLFSVQPMFSKMVLPLLGGTPQVWNTAMLFFQIMLLAGYAYAHGTTRLLSVRLQAVLQLLLLILFVFVLPIAIPPGTIPPTGQDPALWQLSLMAATVGGPFFVLAASAPMLQRWFAQSNHKDADNPYFLYGASNLGSMTALLAYPVLIEPLMDISHQSATWMTGYVVLIGLTALSALMIWRHIPSKTLPESLIENNAASITWKQRFTWLILAFIPSSLMLGVTTFITTDIASVPLLWILPLALYVGTFIIVFARRQIITTNNAAAIQAALLIIMLTQKIAFPAFYPAFLVGIHIALFFFSALTCHLELAKSRPAARHLTEFYLIMSIGGALGGFFNAIIAPQFLVVPIEYPLALVAACLMRYASVPEKKFSSSWNAVKNRIASRGFDSIANPSLIVALIVLCLTVGMASYPYKNILLVGGAVISTGLAYVIDRRWTFATLVAFILVFFPLGYVQSGAAYHRLLHQDRNFFGILKVVDNDEDERILLNGTTNHGTQALDEKYRLTPLSYYSYNSPLRDVFSILDKKKGPQIVGTIGLGVGVTACFQHPGRSFDFFEINPLVKEIAENRDYFTFLSDCGSPYQIIMGDGRLTLQNQPDHHYDLMVIDAFTSDNIPIHLMTVEAIELYLRKIKDDGTLIIHISNRFLDLEPVLEQASEALGVPALVGMSKEENVPDTKMKSYASHWVMFTKNQKTLKTLEKAGWDKARSRKGVKLWTDQYSNIFMVLDNKTALEREMEIMAEKAEKSAQ